VCPVLHEALFALVAPARDLLRRLSAFRRQGSVVANLLDSGPDLLLRLDAALTAPDRARLVGFARDHDLARIACAAGGGPPEIVAQFRPVAHSFGDVAVTPPPGAFLQASRVGEAAIVEQVLAGLPEKIGRKAWIADLFAGCGTLTFPLATRGRVAAFEGDPEASETLSRASAAAGLGARVKAAHRDLVRRPLLGPEWVGCAAAILDPPHAGAAAQVSELVRGKIPRVIYVSCHPAALARDAALLHAAGYRLCALTAIDQFLWSAQVESVSVFAAGRPA
jgi:23S rRNA (uracil1939-C5)-methyltransferase